MLNIARRNTPAHRTAQGARGFTMIETLVVTCVMAVLTAAGVPSMKSLLTRSVAVLLEQDLVTMDRVAQDGMRVRANAGASSFRRGPRLEEFLVEAEQQVEALKKELQESLPDLKIN